MTRHEEWCEEYRAMRARAERIRVRIRMRADEAMREAGLERITLHNALVGEHYGRPWREVDYEAAHEADRWRRREYLPDRIVSAWARETMRASARTAGWGV